MAKVELEAGDLRQSFGLSRHCSTFSVAKVTHFFIDLRHYVLPSSAEIATFAILLSPCEHGLDM